MYHPLGPCTPPYRASYFIAQGLVHHPTGPRTRAPGNVFVHARRGPCTQSHMAARRITCVCLHHRPRLSPACPGPVRDPLQGRAPSYRPCTQRITGSRSTPQVLYPMHHKAAYTGHRVTCLCLCHARPREPCARSTTGPRAPHYRTVYPPTGPRTRAPGNVFVPARPWGLGHIPHGRVPGHVCVPARPPRALARPCRPCARPTTGPRTLPQRRVPSHRASRTTLQALCAAYYRASHSILQGRVPAG